MWIVCSDLFMLPGDSNHHTAITNLGDDLTYDLVKPVLERCCAEQLLRLEHASPVCLFNAYTDYFLI